MKRSRSLVNIVRAELRLARFQAASSSRPARTIVSGVRCFAAASSMDQSAWAASAVSVASASRRRHAVRSRDFTCKSAFTFTISTLVPEPFDSGVGTPPCFCGRCCAISPSPRLQFGLLTLPCQELVGKLLDAFEKNVPRVLGNHEKRLGGAFEVDRLYINAKFLWQAYCLAATPPEHLRNLIVNLRVFLEPNMKDAEFPGGFRWAWSRHPTPLGD